MLHFLALSLIPLSICGCRSKAAKYDDLAMKIVSSVRDDSSFFQSYILDAEDVARVRRDRHLISGPLKIINREDYGDGTYDIGMECGAGVVCIVYVAEKGSTVTADLAVEFK